tara:strand:+ start:3116 stop:4018 length:903 start_codon:yes stop_codon:yes gene_type:complete
MIAGWRRQWSDGGEISSGLPRYLIDHFQARRIGEMGPQVSKMCYPFQVPGTHDIYRPRVVFQEGLPTRNMYRANNFYDAGNGLILFLGEEPWFRIDLYGQAFFQALKELGISKTVAVEGYNGAAPPDLERSVSCIYSHAHMKESLQKFGVRFSNYGSNSRSGPTIGMALVSMAHYQYPQFEVVRLGAMAPMYPFLSTDNDPVGISQDHRSFYDIMRRLKSMFKLDLSLTELHAMGEAESRKLEETLDGIGSSSPGAREIIDRVRSEYEYNPFVEAVDLGPTLDKTLEDILKNTPDERDDS